MSPGRKDEIPERFSVFVVRIMDRLGLPLRTVASHAGMEPASLYRLIQRQQGLPTSQKILDLGRALRLPHPEVLLFLAGRIPANDPLLVELLTAAVQLDRSELRTLVSEVKSLVRDKRAREG